MVKRLVEGTWLLHHGDQENFMKHKHHVNYGLITKEEFQEKEGIMADSALFLDH